MNPRIKIIAIFLVAIIIIVAVWKKFGKGWGIGIAIPIIAFLWFAMSWSMGGPNGWSILFGSYYGNEPKQRLE